jgi:hypothetical protein
MLQKNCDMNSKHFMYYNLTWDKENPNFADIESQITKNITNIFKLHISNLEDVASGKNIKISKILRDPSDIMDEIEASSEDKDGNPIPTHTKNPSFILNGEITFKEVSEKETNQSFSFKVKLSEDGDSILGEPEPLKKPESSLAWARLEVLQHAHTVFQKMFLPSIQKSNAYAVWESRAHPTRETQVPAAPEVQSYVPNPVLRTLPVRPVQKTFNVGQIVRHKTLGTGIIMPALPPKVLNADGQIVPQQKFTPPKTVSGEKVRIKLDSGRVSIVKNEDLV